MTEAELKEVRDTVEHMKECASKRHYFEIPPEDAQLLAVYIHELESSLLRHARYQLDVMALIPAK